MSLSLTNSPRRAWSRPTWIAARVSSSSSISFPHALARRHQMTQAIVEVARPLGIAVHDHIIVGKDGHASLKALKLI
jgi:hypothetical protein